IPSDPKFYLANTLSGLKKELIIGFTSLKRELSEEKRLRSTASSTPKFKKKSNEKQVEVSTQVPHHVQAASSFLLSMTPQAEKAVEELKEGEKKLAHTNKLILIADSAGEDWGVVDGYERRDLADDGNDDKRIRKAEVRAYQKRRRAQSQRKTTLTSQRSFYPALSSVMCNSPAVVHSPNLFLQTPAPSQNTSSTNWPRSSPPCEDPVLPVEGLAIFEASVLFVAFSPQL
ncbi:unnamed protein product, partial [Pocillopora meandrina]